mmetsp:Transcript_76002/g.122761  ORF Transcript_76002/g.122761 Transcript_76002/m.122761 type:complete len:86 (+) Transcript_76002:41-298(+)
MIGQALLKPTLELVQLLRNRKTHHFVEVMTFRDFVTAAWNGAGISGIATFARFGSGTSVHPIGATPTSLSVAACPSKPAPSALGM